MYIIHFSHLQSSPQSLFLIQSESSDHTVTNHYAVMFLKIVAIPLMALLLHESICERSAPRLPPLEKETIIYTKPKQDNRHYRSVQREAIVVEEGYKLEPDLDNDLTPFEQEKVMLENPQLFLQRKRWKRTDAKIRAIRALHNTYEGKKSCKGNLHCKPSFVPMDETK